MLQKLFTLAVSLLLVAGCDRKQQDVARDRQTKVAAEISIGDGIFAAKEKLEALGFQIKHGPDYPTKTKQYLGMIVDYGLSPSGLETFKYSVGMEGSDKPITGLIRATPDGKITSIE